MNTTVVNGFLVQIREYLGHRVLTYSDVDAIHSFSPGTAKRWLNRYREQFADGVDFFRIFKHQYNGNFEEMFSVGDKASSCVVLTWHGYDKVIKFMDNDELEKIYNQMADLYFNVENQNKKDIDSLLDMIVSLQQDVGCTDDNLDAVKKDVEDFRKTFVDLQRIVSMQSAKIISLTEEKERLQERTAVVEDGVKSLVSEMNMFKNSFSKMGK